MNFSEAHIAHLLLKKITGQITGEEDISLDGWKNSSEANRQKYAELLHLPSIQQKLKTFTEAEKRAEQIAIPAVEDVPQRSVHRIHFLKTSWFRYAAAAILIAGAGAYFWTNEHNSKDLAIANGNAPLHTDIAPGGDKAVLTLADGSRIVLDNAANGNLANQGGVQVVKLANGQIAYDLQRLNTKEVMWNTMTTPKGGQYQVTLPDGTKVWLNASSSITFPTAFTGNKREIKMEGEMYFEVAADKQKPFIVNVNSQSLVEVLGTSFNINSYENEGGIKTTLFEGSVRVNPSAILKPGQQAQVTEGEKNVLIKSDVDLDQALAWKNGLFNFDGADIKAVMRQIERWYDIQVQYQGAVPNIIFQGKIYRNARLSEVLDMLSEMGVKFKVDGKKLIVL